jgi:phosphoadenosine phosphosulfate reductase
MTHGEDYTQEVSTLTAGQIVAWAAKRFVGQVAFASALGLEDQAILHLIAAGNLEIPTFTLDTGRLFPQTYDLIARSEYRYGRKIAVTFPDAAQVEQFVAHQGINGFRDGKEQRLACCNVRKIAPLRRALAGKKAWICGLRRSQSGARSQVERIAWDEANGLWKICPLADWTDEQLISYVKSEAIPINPLHEQGFSSIGCACCTRAVPPGEDPRSGRWWWENDGIRECGLHRK